MVELIAMVRRDRAVATKTELARIGCVGYSWFPVLGRGRQRGLQTEQPLAGIPFLPKALFIIFVEETRVDETLEAIIRANQTGEFGDGKIFVLDADEAYRISTGEQVNHETAQSVHSA